jgi:hypothetical protein
MLKVNFKLSGKLTFLSLLLFTMSCEVENTKIVNAEGIVATAAFASNSTKEVIKTQEILNGTWESFDSGSKSKWIFSKGELLKSNIYSFGEAGAPQKYKVIIQRTCGGTISETGKYISLTLNTSKEGKSMCYHIANYSSSEITLESKHGHTVILKK